MNAVVCKPRPSTNTCLMEDDLRRRLFGALRDRGFDRDRNARLIILSAALSTPQAPRIVDTFTTLTNEDAARAILWLEYIPYVAHVAERAA